jgi:hypothetical protein
MKERSANRPFTFLMEDQYDHPNLGEEDMKGSPGDPFNENVPNHDGWPEEAHPMSGTFPLLDPETGEDKTPKMVLANLLALKSWEFQRKSNLHESSTRAWEIYNNDYDFSDKKDWQSQIRTTKFQSAVERIVATLVRMLEDSNSWFDISATNESSELYFNLVENLIRNFLDTKDLRFRKFAKDVVKALALNQHAFVSILPVNDGFKTVEAVAPSEESLFSTGIEDEEDDIPGLSGLIGRPQAPEASDDEDVDTSVLPGKNTFRIDVDVLNTSYCMKDSRSRDLYIITEAYYTVGELKMEAEARGWDMAQVRSAILRGDPGQSRTGVDGISHAMEDEHRGNLSPDKTFGKEAKVTYFYGTLLDERTGDVVERDTFFITVNDVEIVYGPVPLAEVFWGGMIPVIESPFIDVPHAPYGRSPLVDNVSQFIAWNEFYNLMYDYYKQVILGVKEIDTSLIEDWEYDFRDGIWPGQVILTDKSMSPGAQAIQSVGFVDPPAQFHNFVQMFEKELQDSVLLSDTVSGASRSRGRITAMEFQRRAADAGSILESMFETLEERVFVQVIYQVFYRILQFLPQKDWEDFITTQSKALAPTDPEKKKQWDAIYEDLKTWTPKKRWGQLAGKFKFKVRIFSALGDKAADIEAVQLLIQAAANNPAAAQFLNYPRLLRILVRSYGMNPDEVILPEGIPLPDEMMPKEKAGQGQMPQAGQSMGAPVSLSTAPPGQPGTSGVRMK